MRRRMTDAEIDRALDMLFGRRREKRVLPAAPVDKSVARLVRRIIGKHRKTDAGCWEWTGYVNKEGYAEYNCQRVHRLVCADANGLESIPPGMVVMHTCDNRRCVNPEHLRIATQRDNLLDMVRKGRHRGGRRRKR